MDRSNVTLEKGTMDKLPRSVNVSALLRACLAAGFLLSPRDFKKYLATHPREEAEFDEWIGRVSKLLVEQFPNKFKFKK